MKAKQAEWIAEDGCIYTKDPINKFKREHDKVTFEVRASIAFNLHPKIAEHIVQIHNQTLVMNQFAEFLNGNPERYK